MEVTVLDKGPLVLKLNKYHLLAFEMSVQEKKQKKNGKKRRLGKKRDRAIL